MGGLLRQDAVAILDGDDGTRELANLLGARVAGVWPAPRVGRWEADLEASGPMLGARDVDPGERQLLDAHRVHETPPVDGPVYVHLDLDVLDPSLMPAAFAVPGGWTWEELEAALLALPEVAGIEVAGCAPGRAQRVADTLARL